MTKGALNPHVAGPRASERPTVQVCMQPLRSPSSLPPCTHAHTRPTARDSGPTHDLLASPARRARARV